MLDIKQDDYILDIACGNGNCSKWLADKGVKVVAFDYSSKMIELAKKRRANSLDLIDFSICDAKNYNDLLKLKKENHSPKPLQIWQ